MSNTVKLSVVALYPHPNTPKGRGRIDSSSMWDTKRQIIWLVSGITFGTMIVYMDAHDEAGRFDRSVFVFWEVILLAIILTLFYLYSRKKKT